MACSDGARPEGLALRAAQNARRHPAWQEGGRANARQGRIAHRTTQLLTGLATRLFSASTAEITYASIVTFDDRCQTVLRTGIADDAVTLDSVDLQIKGAQNDMDKPLHQVSNFIASGVDVIVATAVDTSAARPLTDAAFGGYPPRGFRKSRRDSHRGNLGAEVRRRGHG